MVANARFLLSSRGRSEAQPEKKAPTGPEPSLGIIWINDGIDGYCTLPGETSVQDDLDVGSPNSGEQMVTCSRDLENFARLWVYIGGLQTALTSGNIQVGLQWQSGFTGTPSINVYLSADTSGSSSYLTDLTGVAEQAQMAVNSGHSITDVNGKLSVDTSGTFILPASTWTSLSQTNTIGHFLFRSKGEGAGQLTIVFLDKSGNQIGQGPGVWMDLREIKELYERWTVGDGPLPTQLPLGQQTTGGGGSPAATAGISNTDLPSGVQSGLRYSSTASGLSVPTDPNGNKYILFVHGWNMSPWEKDAFAETMLKRLYWQGYKGKFGTFQWPTTYVTTGNEEFADVQEITAYDVGEFSAWQSAVPLEQLLVALHRPNAHGNNVYLLAHSMGNVVAGEALRIAGQAGTGQLVNTYLATQSAVPANCYDPTLTGNDLLSFNSLNFNGKIVTGTFGPTTPNIYNNWMMPPTLAMSAKANFFNVDDYALNYWQNDQVLKPDISGLYTYNYTGSDVSGPAQDLFQKTSILGSVTALPLGDSTNVQSRYEIMAYDSEPRSKALGGVSGVAGFTPFNLLQNNFWPQDNFPQTNGPYSAHPWHSAQFRFTYADQQNYWNALMKQFGLPTNQ